MENLETTTVTQNQIETWTRLVSNMTMEEIERRSLLVGMSPSTEENILFQQILTNEYSNRKGWL